MINGALLALLVLTVPKPAAPLVDDTLWVSLETVAAPTQGAPATSQPPPGSSVAVVALPSTAPPAPALNEAMEQAVQASTPQQTRSPDSGSSPIPAPNLAANPSTTQSEADGPAKPTPANRPAPTQSPAQSQSVGGGPKHATSYAARVRLHLETFKIYPPQARRRHQVGVVQLTFVIDRQGCVLTARVTKSSGVAALDQAALDMLAAAQPLPKPPVDVAGERISMTVPVDFGLTT
ncbi:energy transducer TonB [Asticcacaulis sp. MM231]|uniref:energy transducer TonB n=1 Tax=Asticcacaulis sp. MM231 TaxID=3157666 RepID=UPI0032D5AAAA